MMKYDDLIEVGKISRANAKTKVIRDGEEIELSIDDTLYFNDMVKNNDFDIFMDFSNGKEFFLESNEEVLLDEFFLPVDETIDDEEEAEEPQESQNIQTDAIEQEPHPYYVTSHDEKDIYLERDNNMVDINAKVADATLHNSDFTHHEDENIGRDTYIEKPTADIVDKSDSGISNTDNITNIDKPTITGYSEPGSKVVITTENGKVIGIGTCNSQGIYTITTQHIDDGSHNLTITATDRSGNSASVKQYIEVDTVINATDDTSTIKEDGVLINGNVLINDDHSKGESVTTTVVQGTYGEYTFKPDGSYTYKLDNTLLKVQSLSVGETLPDHIEYEITDIAGNTTKAVLSTTITGTNDAPIINAVTAVALKEDDASVTGTVTSSDVDNISTAAYTAPTTAGFSIDPATGKYTFDPANAAYQHLNAGDPLTITIPVTVTDDQGASSTTNIVINMTGTNDGPVIGTVTAVDTNEGDASFNGQLTSTDVDNNSTATYSVATAPAGFTLNSDGSYTFDPTDPAYDNLNAGDKQTITIPVVVTDDNKATSTTDIVIHMTGTNDAPVIGTVTAVDTNEGDASFNGQLTSTDVDNNSTAIYSVATAPAGFTLNSDGSYTFDPTDPAYDNLNAGDKQTITIPVVVTDDNKATSTTDIVIHMTGTNDAPVIGTVTAVDTNEGDASIGGTVTSSDVDDASTATYTAPTTAGFSIDPLTGKYTFDPANAAYQHLNAGDTLQISVPVTVTDDNNATSTTNVVFNMTGTNDAPIAVADTGTVAENLSVTVDVLANDTDLDDNHTFTLDKVSSPKGTATIVGGKLVFEANATDFDHLAVGVKEDVVVTYKMTDENGATSTSTATITVTGTNDAPVVNPASTNAIEDGTVVTGIMTSSDVDDGSSVSYSATNLPAGFTLNSNGTYSFDPSNQAYQHLQDGQKDTLTIPIIATDEHGATGTENLVIHLTGTNDKAVISEVVTEGATEDTHTRAHGVLSVTDVDDTEAHFQADRINGQYGKLILKEDGTWTYRLQNNNHAVQELAEGQLVQDTITVTSADGTTYDLTIDIRGHNDDPVLSNISTKYINEDSQVNGHADFKDVDTNDTHTYRVVKPIDGFSIDPKTGDYTFDSSHSTYDHLQVGQRQTVKITVEVEDNHGGVDQKEMTIVIKGTNDAPVVGQVDLSNTLEDTTLRFSNSDLLSKTTDPEGDKLYISHVSVDPKFGTIVDKGRGDYEYHPAKDYNGDDVPIKFEVGDGRTATAGVALVSVLPVNDKPVVHSVDLGQIDEDTSKTFTEAELLAKTTDIDSPLNLLEVENVRVDSSIGVITGDRVHGFTFTPNLNWNGQKLHINFDVIDDHQAKSSGHAILDVTPVQDPSVITIDTTTPQDFSATEDSTTDNTASGKLNIQDPDRGDNHFRASSTVTGTYGILKITSDGHWTYTLNNSNVNVQELNTNEHVTDNVQIYAKDGTAYTINIDVEGTNDNPVIKSVGSVSVKEDGTQVIGLVDAADVDKGDTLIYSLAHPIDGLSINPTTGEYSFDPSHVTHQPLKEGEHNRIMADIVVKDSHGGTDTQQLVIDMIGTNDKPVVQDVTLAAIDEDTQVKFHASDLLAHTTDVDGDKLTITSVTLQDPTIGTVTEDGKGGYTFKPNHNYNGQDVEFDFVVTDGLVTELGVAYIDVLPINDAPVVHNVNLGHSTGPVTFTSAQLLAKASDVDGDTLHVDGTPTVDAKYGTIVTNPDGSYTFTPATTTVVTNTWALQHPNSNSPVANHPGGTSITTQVQLPPHLHINFAVSDGHISVHAIANISHSSSHVTVLNTIITDVSTTAAIEDHSTNAHGELSIVDPDGSQYNHLNPIHNQVGKYGTFSVDANGKWSYTLLANSHHDIQSLGQGKVIEESFTVTSLDGTTHIVKVPIQGTDDKPVITEVSATTAKEDDTSAINAHGELHITDVDKGEAAFTPANYVSSTYGHLQIDAQGHWTYQLNPHSQAVQQLSEGEPLKDSVTVESVTGEPYTFDVVIHGTNDKPIISMITAQSVNEAGADLNGNIQAIDIDTKDNAHLTFSMKAGESAPSGFSINPDGSYTFDPKDPAYSHITNGHTMVIDIPISVDDGHGGIDTQILKISVIGTNSAPTADATVDLGKTDEDINKDFTEARLISLAHGTDLDGDTLHIQHMHVDPSVGTIKDDGNGHYTFVPKANYHHDDVPITYEITDGQKSVVVRAVLDVTSVNDEPVISHFNLGTINEDTDKHFTAHDLLKHASDVDGDSLALDGIPTIDSRYGTITGDVTNGFVFTPTPDFHQNSLPIHFTVTDGQASVQATAQINVRSVADVAVITDIKTDFATEDTDLVATGQVKVTDADGHSQEHMKASSYIKGHFGHLEIDSAGTWEYHLDQNQNVQYLAQGEIFTEQFTVQSADGTTHPINVDIQGTNDAGHIDGTAAATILENTATVTGKLTVHDVDTSEAHAVANSNMPGTYGHLEVMNNGQWIYHLDNNAQTEALHQGETHTETFTVTSPDGAHKDVVITLKGTNDKPEITGHAVLTHSNEDQVITISEQDLLQNITDVDNTDVLSIHSISAEHGTIVSNGQGGYKYTPHANFNGQEVFHYEVHDNHGGKVPVTMTKEIDAVFDIGTVSVDKVTQDNIINAVESQANVTVSGTATGGDISTGDAVSFTINGHKYTAIVGANAQWSASVAGADLVAQKTFSVNVASTDGTVSGTSTTSHTVSVDTQIDATVSIHDIASDNILNASETGAMVAVTGTVGGDVKDGDTVTLSIGTKTYTGTVDSQSSYSINIAGSELAAATTIRASVTTTDAAHNTITVTTDHAYTVDTVAIAKDDTSSSIGEDNTSINGNVLGNDESGATVTTIGNIHTKFGIYHIDANGDFTYTLDTAKVQHLKAGAHETDSVSYSITDAAGNVASATLSTTINGTNDKPVINTASSSLTGTVVEDARMSTILGHLAISDAEGDSHTITIDQNHDAKYGHLSFNGDTWNYILDNNNPDVDNLFTGDTLTDTIKINIDDGNGGITTQDINIEIDGHSLLMPNLQVQGGAPVQVQADEVEETTSEEIVITLDADGNAQVEHIGDTQDISTQEPTMPSLDNIAQHLEAKSIEVEVPKEALATAATLLQDTTVTTEDTSVIKSVENQEKKEPVRNPDAPELIDSTDADATAQPEEPAEFIPDVHNQMPQEDEHDGTGLTS